MKTLIVGDIHGCYDELMTLITRAHISAEDLIVTTGDLIDRGTKSPEVFRFVRERPNTHCVRGNHERKHLRWAKGEVKPALSQTLAKAQFSDAEYRDALAFMEQMPLYLELPDCYVVHGYVEPHVGWTMQKETVLTGSMSGEEYLEAKYGMKWYEQYDHAKPVVVGHKDYSTVNRPFSFRNRVYGIDTHVHKGGALTGLILPDFQFLSVPAPFNYWATIKDQQNGPPKATWTRWESEIRTSQTSPHDAFPTTEYPKIREYEALLVQANGAIHEFIQWIGEQITRIMDGIRRNQQPKGLSEMEVRQAFGRTVKEHPLHRFFFLYLKKELTPEYLRQRFATPTEFLEFYQTTKN